jgi:hypothetical protein
LVYVELSNSYAHALAAAIFVKVVLVEGRREEYLFERHHAVTLALLRFGRQLGLLQVVAADLA